MTAPGWGLCLGCYEEGKRLMIERTSPLMYHTVVVDVESLPPEHRVRPPGVHNWVVDPQGVSV